MEFLVERWNAQISGGTPVAKAVLWAFPDAEERKRGERTGLDTPVVIAEDRSPTGGCSGEYCTMGGSLMQQRRVRDDGLRVVNRFRL